MTARISSDPAAWGPAILAMLADHHGLAGSPRTFRRLFSAQDGGLTLASLVAAAEAFGFETQAGQLPSYDDLKDLPVLPAVVHLRRKVPEKMLVLGKDGALEDVGHEGRFAVVHQADDVAVDLEDPAEGRLRMPRSELEAAWRGIVLCVAPNEDQELRREGPAARLAKWLDRLPPLVLNVLGCVLVFVLGAVLARALDGRAVLAAAGALTAALAASVWALRTSSHCPACAAAVRELGLPLAPLGVVYYAGLLVALGLWGLVPLTEVAVEAAAGVHLALLAHLAASRAHCRTCVTTAVAAWGAAGLVLGGQGIGWYAAALPAAALGTMLAVRFFARRTGRLRRAMLGAIREILTKEAGPDPGNLRLIVYKLDSCPRCRLVEKEVLPPLAAMLGERLSIERRPAGVRIPAPTLVFLSGARRVAMIGVPDGDDLREALSG